ncbi:MAG: IS3 family transposase [Acidobacteriota bacterium]
MAFFAKKKSMRYRFIDAEKVNHPIRLMCRCCGSRQAGTTLGECENRVGARSRTRVCWSRFEPCMPRASVATEALRVCQELGAAGRRVSRKRVARLMRQNGLRAVGKRRFRVTPQSEHKRRIAPNLLAREFRVTRPNRAWVGDITYVPTMEGWLYWQS